MPHVDFTHLRRGKRELNAERRVQAMELRKAGLSYEQIGKRIGVGHSQAHRLVKAALTTLAEKELESAEHVRTIELQRLDLALTQVAQVLANSPKDETKLRAVDRLIRISESRRKLLGVDMETATVNVDQRSVTFIIEPMRAEPADVTADHAVPAADQLQIIDAVATSADMDVQPPDARVDASSTPDVSLDDE